MARPPDDRARGGKRKDCHERALGLLAVRPRSRRELQRRLAGAGFDPAEVDDVLDRLESVGLIDDDAFARSVVEHAIVSRKEAPRAAARRLAMAGVERGIAEAAIAELSGDEEERAGVLAAERAGRLRGLPPAVAHRRLSDLLVRRGYAGETARRAARRALAAEGLDGAGDGLDASDVNPDTRTPHFDL